MKGTIHYALEEMIKSKYSEEAWQKCALAMGYEDDFSFALQIQADIDEAESLQLFVKSAETLSVPLSEVFDNFGEYWCCEYAPQLYKVFYIGLESTKQALTKLDWIHEAVTKRIENSRPPRFKYSWINEEELILNYQSSRPLIDLLISLIKGLDKYFGNQTNIEKLSSSELKLRFDK
jgi:hypothetical protein